MCRKQIQSFLCCQFPHGPCVSRGTSVFLVHEVYRDEFSNKLTQLWVSVWVCMNSGGCSMWLSNGHFKYMSRLWERLGCFRELKGMQHVSCSVVKLIWKIKWQPDTADQVVFVCLFVCLAGLMCPRGALNSLSHVGMVWSQLQHCGSPMPAVSHAPQR